MRQRRLTVFIIILIAIVALVFYRVYSLRNPSSNQPPFDKAEPRKRSPSGRRVAERDKRSNIGTKEASVGSGIGAAKRIGSNEAVRNASAAAPAESFAQDRGSITPGDHNFNRRISKIIYSRHARCRMDCRHIDESEIREIRDSGKINFSKSQLKSKRDPKYALEGITHDQQHVRIVFAQTSDALVVVTCIDLDTTWACSCN